MFTFIALCAKKKNAWAAFTSIAAIEGLAGLLLIENEPINRKIQERRRAKAEVQEEIDEWTMFEMKSEPTAREKRMMELEQKKKAWMQKKSQA